jgi:hypothetical protein
MKPTMHTHRCAVRNLTRLPGLLLMICLLSFPGLSEEIKEKEITLRGEGLCAKCELKQTQTCQNALRLLEGNKTIIYYLEQNPLSRNFHKYICAAPKRIVVTGTVREEKGKRIITATKLSLEPPK